ncbi:hypothetical protein I545_0927 [Mycobacterium kansasii 662]|uniref:Uncharacterized protein n=1 Tax=Mycobacterium kansasii 662 TaxID=1299326 RepID=X7ZUF9_MYCKA|nr:hypothetical protein I547_0352 [Mycobacterium kansasii 824]EUA22343.1 hypothetical protein I545_0927 [Mycobacterium kansasii 662]KEP42982.1 hypothetical protein MKSMC1_18500 [Mycobacterium kansasii]
MDVVSEQVQPVAIFLSIEQIRFIDEELMRGQMPFVVERQWFSHPLLMWRMVS